MFNPGLVHTPVTPFKGDQSIDYDTYAKVSGISPSQRRRRAGAAHARGRGHEPDRSGAATAHRIRDRAGRGAACRSSPMRATRAPPSRWSAPFTPRRRAPRRSSRIRPYFWHPKPAMVVEHLVRIGSAVGLPFFICQPTRRNRRDVPDDGDRAPAGRPAARISPGSSMRASTGCSWWRRSRTARAIRRISSSCPAPSSSSRPRPWAGRGCFHRFRESRRGLVRRLDELCREEKYIAARPLQEEIAALHHAVREAGSSKLKDGLAGIKAAMAYMGRDCGVPRPPVRPLGQERTGEARQKRSTGWNF